MLKRKIVWLMALVLSAGLVLSACGDDEPAENNNTPANNGTDAGDTDEGDTTSDAGDTDVTEEGCTSDEDCAAGLMCDTTNGQCVAAPSGCDLTGEDRPARCDQDFAGTTFGPGSIVTSFQVAGVLTDGSAECCFDYDSSQEDGDEDIDNALGTLLADFEQLESINDSLTESIANGQLILMFEHDGLTDLSAGESYGLNFWLGQFDQSQFISTGPGVDCTTDDCADPACQFTSVCTTPGENCSSSFDEDGDGDTSCEDSDCTGTSACLGGVEVCNSGADDDGDGDADCADSDCALTSMCVSTGETCDNTSDDDGDGAADCADIDCFGVASCQHDNTLLIDPASVDQGTYPQARVQNATIDGTSLSAGPGTVRLDIEILGTPLSLVISQAQIEAEVDMDKSSIEDGVWLTEGKLGGVVRLDDVLTALNGFAANSCECLGLGDKPLVTYDPDDVGCFEDGTFEGEDCQCNVVTADANACEEAGESTCATIASNCSLVYGVLPTVADVDTDSDGTPDAISIGTHFETVGAKFSGIAAE